MTSGTAAGPSTSSITYLSPPMSSSAVIAGASSFSSSSDGGPPCHPASPGVWEVVDSARSPVHCQVASPPLPELGRQGILVYEDRRVVPIYPPDHASVRCLVEIHDVRPSLLLRDHSSTLPAPMGLIFTSGISSMISALSASLNPSIIRTARPEEYTTSGPAVFYGERRSRINAAPNSIFFLEFTVITSITFHNYIN